MPKVHCLFISKVSSGAKFSPSQMVCKVHRQQEAHFKALPHLPGLHGWFLTLVCHHERFDPMGWKPAVGELEWGVQSAFTPLSGVQMRVQSTVEQLCCWTGDTSANERGQSSLGGGGGSSFLPSSAQRSSVLHHMGNQTQVVLLRAAWEPAPV